VNVQKRTILNAKKMVEERLLRFVDVCPNQGFWTLKFKKFELFAFQVVDLLEIKTGFPGRFGTLKLWIIERVELKENWIWPICLFNEGNEFDFAQTQNYLMLDFWVGILRRSKKITMKLLKQKRFLIGNTFFCVLKV
jgi:hypothetical protein